MRWSYLDGYLAGRKGKGSTDAGGRPLVAFDISLQRWRVFAMLAIGLVAKVGASFVGSWAGSPHRLGQTGCILGRRGISRDFQKFGSI
jgi:hypothetical protein